MDFVQEIGQYLSPEILHNLTSRMLARGPDRGRNAFLNTCSLEKTFLAYEICRYKLENPQLVETHFESERVKQHFPTDEDISNLKDNGLTAEI